MPESFKATVVSAAIEQVEPAPIDPRRRGFLLALGVGGASAAAAALKTVAPVSPITPEIAAPDSAGYRESAHIRNYYRTAKI